MLSPDLSFLKVEIVGTMSLMFGLTAKRVVSNQKLDEGSAVVVAVSFSPTTELILLLPSLRNGLNSNTQERAENVAAHCQAHSQQAEDGPKSFSSLVIQGSGSTEKLIQKPDCCPHYLCGILVTSTFSSYGEVHMSPASYWLQYERCWRCECWGLVETEGRVGWKAID